MRVTFADNQNALREQHRTGEFRHVWTKVRIERGTVVTRPRRKVGSMILQQYSYRNDIAVNSNCQNCRHHTSHQQAINVQRQQPFGDGRRPLTEYSKFKKRATFLSLPLSLSVCLSISRYVSPTRCIQQGLPGEEEAPRGLAGSGSAAPLCPAHNASGAPQTSTGYGWVCRI